MEPWLVELLAAVESGVVRVQADGRVGHANAAARRLVEIGGDGRLADADLRHALACVRELGLPLPTRLRLEVRGGAQVLSVAVAEAPEDGAVWLVLNEVPDRRLRGQALEALLRYAGAPALSPPIRPAVNPPGSAEPAPLGLGRLALAVDTLERMATPQIDRLQLVPLLHEAAAAWGASRAGQLPAFGWRPFAGAGPVLYGDPVLLARAAGECLRAAGDVAPAGARLMLELVENSPWLQFRVEVGGASPGAAAAAALDTELALARCIVLAQGGDVRVEPDADGLSLVLELSTGAAPSVDEGMVGRQAEVFAAELGQVRQLWAGRAARQAAPAARGEVEGVHG